jgi:hypothetical protein
VQRKAHEDLGRVVGQDALNPVMRRPATTFKRAASRFFCRSQGPTFGEKAALGERFQSSNHMGCSKRPHSVDGKPKMQLSGFVESVV